MTPFSLWIAIIGMGVITFLLRFLIIALSQRWTVPPRLEHALRYVSVAVLSALIIPDMLIRNQRIDLVWGNERLWGGLVALLIAYKTKSVLWTLFAGMAIFWLVRAL